MSNRKAKRKILKELPLGSPPKADQPRAGKTNNLPIVNGQKLIVILGQTASGKTRLAVKLSKAFSGEIVSADSRQVYRRLNLGAGKDLKEYGKTPYHLIDIADPKKQFSLSDWQRLAYQKIEKIHERGKLPFLVGGSGLYLQSITDGYILSAAEPQKKLRGLLDKKSLDELQKLAQKFEIRLNYSDFNNKRRLIRAIELKQNPGLSSPAKKPRYDCLILGIKINKEKIDKRINSRLKQRFSQGMVAEVKKLKKSGLTWKRLDDFGLEYRYIAKFLKKEISYSEMTAALLTEIKRFSKRQETWFKRMKNIIWIKNEGEASKMIKKFLK